MFRSLITQVLVLVAVGAAVFGAFWGYSLFTKTTPEQRLAALEKEVKPTGGQVYRTVLHGEPVTFLVLGCSVYLLDFSSDEVKRYKVLRAGDHYSLEECTGQAIWMDGGLLHVYLENRAIGAGGGNTSGGTYRSKDGLGWEKRTGSGWQSVAEAQH